MATTAELNERFALNEQLEFHDSSDGYVIARVTNHEATADIMLQGAQLISWVPIGQRPVIWLSPEARFSPGKSLRGGIPICWPWFGANESNPDLAAHGFARNMLWDISASEALEDGRTRLTFTLGDAETKQSVWHYRTALEYNIVVGKALDLELVTTNTDTSTLSITEALHTYFNIGDIAKVRVYGLEDTEFLDKVDYGQRKIQQGPVMIDTEVDRVYLGTRANCIIEDHEYRRKILIHKQGSESTIVWNPWIAKSRKLGDMGEEGYRKMICIESGNAAEDQLDIAPGETHQLQVSYRVEEIS